MAIKERPENPEETERKAKELGNLLDEIVMHNIGHSSMALSMRGLVQEMTSEEPNTFSLDELQHDVHIELSALRRKYGTSLKDAGLSIGLKSNDTEDASFEFALMVQNVLDFLHRLHALAKVEAVSISLPQLQSLSKGVYEQILRIDFEKPTKKEKALLENTPAIIDALIAIAPAIAHFIPIRKLQALTPHIQRGNATEYVTIDKLGLWSKQGEGFGPADWVKDATPKVLDLKWKEAVAQVHMQEKKESGLGKELQEHLTICIAQAGETLRSLSWDEQTKAELREVLKKYATLLLEKTVKH